MSMDARGVSGAWHSISGGGIRPKHHFDNITVSQQQEQVACSMNKVVYVGVSVNVLDSSCASPTYNQAL